MHILLAESCRGRLSILTAQLEAWGFRVQGVSDGPSALTALQSPQGPRLALLNWDLPRMPGPEVCYQVRNCQADRYAYLLLISERERVRDMVFGIRSGADDYISRPFHPEELRARLHAATRQLSYNQQLLNAREEVLSWVRRDCLTGCENRWAILKSLRREYQRGCREGKELSVVMVDLDGFKAINDLHGHLIGDEVIRQVSRWMGEAIRPGDHLGRYGGDEFLIVLPDCDAAEAVQVGQRVCETIRGQTVVAGNQRYAVTASVGVASAPARDPEAGEGPEAFLHAADTALYAAKSAGRDCVRSADQEVGNLSHESRVP